jgi:hypothetical protein
LPENLSVIARGDADEDANWRPSQAIGCGGRGFQCLPCSLEQQALLRVHGRCFARRDAEQLRLEPIDLREKTSSLRGHLAGRLGIGIEKSVGVPPIARHLRNGVSAISNDVPELLDVLDTAGESTSRTDDREWLVFRFFARV